MYKFKNLKAEMARYGLKSANFAPALKCTPQTVRRKFNGEVKITINEAKKVVIIFQEKDPSTKFTIDYLFAE